MPNPQVDAEGFPIASTQGNALKLDAEGFPIKSAKVSAPKLDAEGFPIKATKAPDTSAFEAFKAAHQEAPTPVDVGAVKAPEGHLGALQSGFDPMAAGVSAGNAIEAKGKDFLGWLKAVPGRLEQWAEEENAKDRATYQAQGEKLGTVGREIYNSPVGDVVEAAKGLVQKGQRLWQAIKPNQAKAAAQNAEFEMERRVNEIGDRQPTPAEAAWFKTKMDLAEKMWAASETERAARKKAVQDFQERSANWIAPGLSGNKFVGNLIPLALQGALAPETIAPEMALNTLAQGQLSNPTYEQGLGQQVKELALGAGAGALMKSGFPGVPVSRALQGLGVSPLPANVLGTGVTSVANTLGGHQLARFLTTAHGEAPPQPTASDYLGDLATQFGLSAHDLNAPADVAPAGAPPLGERAIPVGMGVEPLKTPSAPGSLNAPPVESRPLPAPLAQSRGPVRKPAETLAQLGGLNVPGPEGLPEIQPRTYQGPLAGEGHSNDLGHWSWDAEYNQWAFKERPIKAGDTVLFGGKERKVTDVHEYEPGNDKMTSVTFEPMAGEPNNGPAHASELIGNAQGEGKIAQPSKPPAPSEGVVTPGIRVQPDASAGLPDAYGLAPVEVAAQTPTPRANLHEHEAEMAVTRQQRMGDRNTLVNGPLASVSDIAPEHHAEADRILEARNIVTVTERRALEAEREILNTQIENRKREAAGKAPNPVAPELEQQVKARNAPGMDDLRQIAASEPSHPDVQRSLQVAQEQQQALAAEYAASTPGGEGDITHVSRIATKEPVEEPGLWAKTKEFFGGASTTPAEEGIPGTGKRPKQKNEYSRERKYETVDGPVGPVVVYRELNPDGSHDIVGRSGKILESDITGRRESTKDEITHATSQVEDPDTGEISLGPDQAIHFSQNPVAAAVKARESARDAIRGRRVIDNLKANPKMFREGEPAKGSEWRNVADLPITQDIKNRLAPGSKAASVRSDVAQTLIEYFGQAHAKEASFLSGLDKMTRHWTERGLLTNVFAHFPNQFAHGLGALSGEGLNPQEATKALSHAYREGQDPNSEYVNRARAAGVKQMSQGRIFGEGDNATAHEVATQKLEAALGHAPGTLGKAEGNSLKRAFQALNQKTVWQVDDAIRNTLFYQKVASGMTPEQAARYANENYVGYHTDTNLFELNPDRSPRFVGEIAKKTANEIYRNLVTGKGETGKGFAGAGASLARTLVSPLFLTFRTNSATLFGHEIKEAATGLPRGDLKGLGKLANVGTVGSAVGGMVGQTLSDLLLSEKEKKQGKEYHMRMGGPFHWTDTAEKALEGRATPMQTAAAIATPNPLFRHLIGKGIFGVDVQSGRQAHAKSLSELGDTLVSSVLPTGDIARNALQGQGNAKDVAASFMMGKNAPKPGAQIMLSHPDKMAMATPDYEQTKANYRLISTLRNLPPGSAEYNDAIQQAVKDQKLTRQQIINATKRSGQSELEHMRALAKIATPDSVVAAADTYRESSPEIARALYAEAQKKLSTQAKKFTGERNLKLLGQIQHIENRKLLLR